MSTSRPPTLRPYFSCHLSPSSRTSLQRPFPTSLNTTLIPHQPPPHHFLLKVLIPRHPTSPASPSTQLPLTDPTVRPLHQYSQPHRQPLRDAPVPTNTLSSSAPRRPATPAADNPHRSSAGSSNAISARWVCTAIFTTKGLEVWASTSSVMLVGTSIRPT